MKEGKKKGSDEGKEARKQGRKQGKRKQGSEGRKRKKLFRRIVVRSNTNRCHHIKIELLPNESQQLVSPHLLY